MSPEDQTEFAAWVELGTKVLAGHYKNPTNSERESIAIGLRCYPSDSTCQKALEKIDPKKLYRK